MNYKLRSFKAEQNTNPVKPRKLKPYRVSFVLEKEIDENGLAPLHFAEITALSGIAASTKVCTKGRIVIRAYRNYGFPPSKDGTHRVCLKSQDYSLPKNAPRHCLYCGEELPKSKRYCPPPKNCFRIVKNQKQLKAKRERVKRAKQAKKKVCSNCASPKLYPKTDFCEICLKSRYKCARRDILARLVIQIPEAYDLYPDGPDACASSGKYKGILFPRCNKGVPCRSCLDVWLGVHKRLYADLKRPIWERFENGKETPTGRISELFPYAFQIRSS
jgi:hypothetical protein